MELTELAQNYFGDTRGPSSLAGPIGAFIIAALAVTTVLLIRNMNARIRRLPERFPDQPGQRETPPPPAGADSSGSRDAPGNRPGKPGGGPGKPDSGARTG